MFNDVFRKTFALGLGVLTVTKDKAEEVLDDLVKRGEMAPQESKDFLQHLMKKGEEEREALGNMVREQVSKVLTDWHIATEEEIAKLQKEVIQLQQRIDQLEHQVKDQQKPSV